MKPFFFLLCSLSAVVGAAERKTDASVQIEVEKIIRAKNYPPASLGILIKEMTYDTVVAAYNSDSMFNPASVTKLLTAAAAFDQLGPSCFFATRIFTDTVLAHDTSLTVRNLYIQGAGDPGFTAERLWLFVEHLYHCGIRKITGNLALDDFLFDSVTVGPGFDEDSTSRAYQSLISALAMNFNTVAVHCRPGPYLKRPVAVDLFPEMRGLKVISQAATAPTARKNEPEIETSCDAGTTVVTVKGTMGIDENGIYNFVKLWQTWEAFGDALVPLFAKRGIVVTGRVIHERVPRHLADRGPFYEFLSEPLSASINRMFKYSSNFTAEMLFKALSARRDTTQGSWDRSAALVNSWWRERNFPGMPVIKNGSGMGNTNRITPAQTVALLLYVWKQKSWLPDYLAALSTAGYDGTLKSRFAKSPLKGMIRAKTGTLNALGINTLAGYLLLPRSSYAFAIFCNKTGHTQYEDWVMQEQILEKVGALAR
jgi:D-alanyl-D-alanine carboxypeptidase/D-alanyl-D-alanine-endopeptidase (penicillin-binding protein 4)